MSLPEEPVHEGVTSLGSGTGVEAELGEQGGGDVIRQPFDPEKIEVGTRSMTVQLLLARIKAHAIDLAPDFQRRAGIWTDLRQSRLIESLLLKIPLPTLYAAEDSDENWMIVDGIQRLTAISRFIDPSIVPHEEKLTLQGLEYLGRDFNGADFENLPPRLQRRLMETELVVHLIRHGTPEEVKYNIFARINTGGVPLSSQELRHALIPGKARDVLKDWASSASFKRATSDSIKDERMADRELVLRFVAFRITPYSSYKSSDFDNFLREAMHAINKLNDDDLKRLRQDFERAMDAAYCIFGNDAFRKRYRHDDSRYPINKALFEAVSANLAELDEVSIEKLVEKGKDVRGAFIRLMQDSDFDRSISQGTGDTRKVHIRFSEIGALFQSVMCGGA